MGLEHSNAIYHRICRSHSLLLVEHRASTAAFHFLLSLALIFFSFQVRSVALISLCKLLLRVCLERPLFLLPCGFHTCACLALIMQDMANPLPAPPSDLWVHWLLVSSRPQFTVRLSVEPFQVQDSPVTSVVECIDLSGSGDGNTPCLRPIERLSRWNQEFSVCCY